MSSVLDYLPGLMVVMVFLGGWIVLPVVLVILFNRIKRKLADPLEEAFNAPSAKSRYDYPMTTGEEK